jgi:hypothetical protein
MPVRISNVSQFALFVGALCAAINVPLAPAQTTTALITACVAKSNGVTRIVAAPSACIAGVETVVQFDQKGPAGNSGPAGPTGPTGPQGPAGSGGGGVTYSASFTVPSNASGGTVFEMPILGANVQAGSLPANYVASGNSCKFNNFTMTGLNSTGTSNATMYLVYRTTTFPSNFLVDLCTLTGAGPSDLGSPTSCTAQPNFQVQQGLLLGYYLVLFNAQDFAGQTFFMNGTCQ